VLAGSGVRATALSAGYGRTCAITTAGSVSCWGNWYDRADWSHRHPHPIPGTEGATAVRVYQDHGCAILRDQSVRCWGYNRAGELGHGEVAESMIAVPSATPVRW
jgi:alpha-tubulin suppressor-like RCC1 family protein